MNRIGMMGVLLAGFLGGIFFVYSCGGGGSSASADSEELLARVAALEEKLANVSAVAGTLNGLAGPHVIISGANLHVRNGMARTTSTNGLGNLIVGCNEASVFPAYAGSRYGSHNLVVGPEHRYTKAGGFVAGWGNRVNAAYASVSGGDYNTASGAGSSVSGGDYNTASGTLSSVSGGNNNTAGGEASSISGGGYNWASVAVSSISGGYDNTASGNYSAVSGSTGLNASTTFKHLP
jgi:hypothetical protein